MRRPFLIQIFIFKNKISQQTLFFHSNIFMKVWADIQLEKAAGHNVINKVMFKANNQNSSPFNNA